MVYAREADAPPRGRGALAGAWRGGVGGVEEEDDPRGPKLGMQKKCASCI